LDENGLIITRHTSAAATFEKRTDVFFMRFYVVLILKKDEIDCASFFGLDDNIPLLQVL
jgi:hypothetical protein